MIVIRKCARWCRSVSKQLRWKFLYQYNPLVKTDTNCYPTPVRYESDFEPRLEAELESLGVNVQCLPDFRDAFSRFMAESAYPEEYFSDRRVEKQLEHFLTLYVMGAAEGDVWLDVGSNISPFPSYLRSRIGCRAIQQDLRYPAGLHGDRLGADVAQLGLPPEAVSRISLHCTLEHFTGDIDRRAITEFARVLRPGGQIMILPLYFFYHHVTFVNPFFGAGITQRKASGSAAVYTPTQLSHYEHQYDPAAFIERIALPLQRSGAVQILKNPWLAELGSDLYARYALHYVKNK